MSPGSWAQSVVPTIPGAVETKETVGPPAPAPEPPLPPLPPGAAALAPGELEPLQPLRPKDPVQLRIQKNQKLSLEEAVDLALQRNPSLVLARLQIEQAKSQVRVSQSALFPSISFNGGYTFNQSSTSKFVQATRQSIGGEARVGNFTIIDTANLTGSLAGSWTFYSFGAVEAGIEASLQSQRSFELQLEIQTQDLRLQVIQAYYNLQLQASTVEIAQAALRNARASLKDARAQERAGTGTRFSVLQAEVQVSNNEQTLLGNQNQYRIAQRNLATLLNFETPTDVTVDVASQAGSWDLSLEDSIFRALNDRLELQQQEAQQKSSEAQAQANRASLLPTFNLVSTFDLYQNLNFPEVPTTDGYAVGVVIRWNIYDGGAAYANAEIARRKGQISQVQFTGNSNTIRLGVESSFFTLNSSGEQITTARRGETLAKESLRLARLRFTSGVGTQTDVINAENALTQAQGNLAQAIINYNISLAQLKRALNLL